MTTLSKAEFELTLADIEQRMEQMQRDARRLIATVRQWTAVGPFDSPFDDILIWIDAQVEETKATIARYLPYPGKPWILSAYGSEWSGPGIAGLISEQAAKPTLDEFRVDEFWIGPAAETYKNSLKRQTEALSAIAGFARNVDDALTSMATVIWFVWLVVLAAIIELILICVAGGAAAATGVGIPPGVAAVAAGIAKFIAVFLAALIAACAFVWANALPKIQAVQQNRYDSTAFPDGHWPRPRGHLIESEASAGDPSAWRLKEA